MTESRKRHTREDWIDAAERIFVRTGIEDVKVDVIAKRMKITRGSFYWHFKSREDLLDSLLDRWAEQNRQALIELKSSAPGGVPTIYDCIRFWLSIENDILDFDLSMRLWGRKSPKVAGKIHEIDDAWMSLLTEVFITRGHERTRATARARVTYFHQLGYHLLDLQEPLQRRIQMIPLYQEILVGELDGPELTALLDEYRDALSA